IIDNGRDDRAGHVFRKLKANEQFSVRFCLFVLSRSDKVERARLAFERQAIEARAARYEALMRGQTDLRVGLPANVVVVVKVDLDVGPSVIGPLEEAAGLPEPGTGFGSQFRLARRGEGLEGKPGDGLLDTLS